MQSNTYSPNKFFSQFFSVFLSVFLKGQTYLNTMYLFLAFPLGLFYFIFLVVGLSVGIPLVIVWVGLIVLLGVFAGWYGMIAFERQVAIWLLREDIPPMTRQELARQDLAGQNPADKSLWQKFTATLANPVTWKGLVYLLAKFPLGLFSFIVLVTLLSLSLGLLATPFYYQSVSPNYVVSLNGVSYVPLWVVDTLPEALLCSLIGAFIGLISLHIFNGLAWVSGKFARVMLGNFSPVPTPPVGGPGEPAVVSTALPVEPANPVSDAEDTNAAAPSVIAPQDPAPIA